MSSREAVKYQQHVTSLHFSSKTDAGEYNGSCVGGEVREDRKRERGGKEREKEKKQQQQKQQQQQKHLYL